MTDAFPYAICPADIEAMLGPPTDVAGDALAGLDYRDASEAELAEFRAQLDDILKDTHVGASLLPRWEDGWGEVLARVRSEGVSQASLTPQYFRHRLLRLRGRMIQARSVSFEPTLYGALKSVIFRRHLADSARIVEFGCGTGLNLYQFHGMFPRTKIVGCDWARPSQDLIALIAAATGADMRGMRFDMRTLEGKDAVALDGETAILTLHALEQLGRDFAPFLDFLVRGRPKLGLHLEPIVELYDPAQPLDANAIAYHRKRGYLEGFLPALRAHPGVRILEERRLGFGSRFHEAYTLIVWKPR